MQPSTADSDAAGGESSAGTLKSKLSVRLDQLEERLQRALGLADERTQLQELSGQQVVAAWQSRLARQVLRLSVLLAACGLDGRCVQHKLVAELNKLQQGEVEVGARLQASLGWPFLLARYLLPLASLSLHLLWGTDDWVFEMLPDGISATGFVLWPGAQGPARKTDRSRQPNTQHRQEPAAPTGQPQVTSRGLSPPPIATTPVPKPISSCLC